VNATRPRTATDDLRRRLRGRLAVYCVSAAVVTAAHALLQQH